MLCLGRGSILEAFYLRPKSSSSFPKPVMALTRDSRALPPKWVCLQIGDTRKECGFPLGLPFNHHPPRRKRVHLWLQQEGAATPKKVISAVGNRSTPQALLDPGHIPRNPNKLSGGFSKRGRLSLSLSKSHERGVPPFWATRTWKSSGVPYLVPSHHELCAAPSAQAQSPTVWG